VVGFQKKYLKSCS
jgi:hypothetical protein